MGTGTKVQNSSVFRMRFSNHPEVSDTTFLFRELSYIDKCCLLFPYFWHLFPSSNSFLPNTALVVSSQLDFTISNDAYSRIKQCSLISVRLSWLIFFFFLITHILILPSKNFFSHFGQVQGLYSLKVSQVILTCIPQWEHSLFVTSSSPTSVQKKIQSAKRSKDIKP